VFPSLASAPGPQGVGIPKKRVAPSATDVPLHSLLSRFCSQVGSTLDEFVSRCWTFSDLKLEPQREAAAASITYMLGIGPKI
jgi:hypothetical protein